MFFWTCRFFHGIVPETTTYNSKIPFDYISVSRFY